MSYQNRIRDLFHDGHPDRTLAKVGVVVSVLLLSLRLVAVQPLIVVIPVSTGTACLFYLATQNRRVGRVSVPRLPRPIAGFLPSFTVLGVATFVTLAWTAGGRTLPAYLLAGAVGTAIIVQILLFDDDLLQPGLVLFQVVLAGLAIRFAGLLTTPGYIGIDIWTHLGVYVDGIVSSGSLSAISDTKYVLAPIYHGFASVATLVFGSPRPAVYFTLGLAIPLAVLFVYGTGKLLLPVRWALLAATLYTFADQFILWSLHIIPTSLAVVFFLALVYCVTRLFVADVEGWVVALTFAFSLAIVFTHQVSTAVMLVFLAVAAVAALLGDASRGWPRSAGLSATSIALSGVLAVNAVVTAISWANTPFTGDDIFLWRMLEIANHLVAERAGFLNLVDRAPPGGGGAQSQTLLDLLVPFVELFGFALLLSAAVVGGLVMLRWDRSIDLTATYLLTAGGLFVATFGLSILGIRVFLPGRWLVFLYVPLVIIAAAGLHHVFRSSPRRVILAVVVVLAVGYPTTMVVAERATIDSPAFADDHVRFSYTASEIAAVETIGEIYPPSIGEQILSDHPYQKLFEPVGGYAVSDTLPLRDGTAVAGSPVVYRDYQSTGPVKFTLPEDRTALYVQRVAPAAVCDPSRNVVYANDHVRFCTRSPATGVSS